MRTHVNFHANFNLTGVGRHCEHAFFSMMRNRTRGMTLNYVDRTREASLRRALESANPQTDTTLFFERCPESQVRQFAGRKVIWWFFESNVLPAKWLEELRPFDEIWAPSTWARGVLLAHGVAQERVRFIESGVNSSIFAPTLSPKPQTQDGFVFLSVAKYENRKSIDETVAAFVTEFPADRNPSVQLWLKVDFSIFPQRVQQLAQRLAHDRRIRVLSGNFTDEQMADLYRSADAFVFPSKAEGFGLPCLEAIACGVPVIATNVSAQSVFLDRIAGLFSAVDYEVVPIEDADYAHFYAEDYAGTPFGSWAMPSVDSIRRAMRDMRENPAAWRNKALQASARLRGEFSWEVIAAKAIGAVVEGQVQSSAASSSNG